MTDFLFDFAARFVLGMETAERVTEVATEALATGLDSQALRSLAALDEPRAEDLKPILEEALLALGKDLPSPREAAHWLARKEALKMLRKEVAPYEGSRAIWAVARSVPGEAMATLDPFIYAASEWEDRPEDRHLLERGMLRAAEDLVEEGDT